MAFDNDPVALEGLECKQTLLGLFKSNFSQGEEERVSVVNAGLQTMVFELQPMLIKKPLIF